MFWCSFEVDNRGELSLVGLLIKVEFDSINHTSEMSKRKNIRDTSVLERSTAFTSLNRLDMRINISSGPSSVSWLAWSDHCADDG